MKKEWKSKSHKELLEALMQCDIIHIDTSSVFPKPLYPGLFSLS